MIKDPLLKAMTRKITWWEGGRDHRWVPRGRKRRSILLDLFTRTCSAQTRTVSRVAPANGISLNASAPELRHRFVGLLAER